MLLTFTIQLPRPVRLAHPLVGFFRRAPHEGLTREYSLLTCRASTGRHLMLHQHTTQLGEIIAAWATLGFIVAMPVMFYLMGRDS